MVADLQDTHNFY